MNGSTEKYFGDNHVFTSRSNTDTINIKSSADEHLKIAKIQNEKIYSRDYSDNFGLNEISREESIYQHSSSIAYNQGSRISVAGNNGTFLITSAYVESSPTDSGVALFRNSGTLASTFVENPTLLVNTSFTSNSFSGLYNAINEDGSIVVFSDFPENASSINIYKRTGGSTWSFSQLINGGGLSVKVSGSSSSAYIVSQSSSGAVNVYKSNGTSFSLQQNILNAGSVSHIFEIYEQSTIAIVDTSIKVYKRVGTTWSLNQTITSATTVTNIRLCDNRLFFTNTAGLHIYKRVDSDPSSLFTLFQVIPQTGITLLASYDGRYVFTHDDEKITIYKDDITSYVKSVNTTPDEGTESMVAIYEVLFLGKPSLLEKGQIYIKDFSEYTNTVIENNKITMDTTNLKIKSEYGTVEVESDLLVNNNVDVTGNLSVTGNFTQQYSMKLAMFKSGTDQLVPDSEDTKVLFPTSVFNEIPFLSYSSGNFTVTRACKVIVTASFRHTNTVNEAWIRINGTSDFYGQQKGPSQLNPTAILKLAANDYFSVFTYTSGANSNISITNDPWNVSNIQIYVLS